MKLKLSLAILIMLVLALPMFAQTTTDTDPNNDANHHIKTIALSAFTCDSMGTATSAAFSLDDYAVWEWVTTKDVVRPTYYYSLKTTGTGGYAATDSCIAYLCLQGYYNSTWTDIDTLGGAVIRAKTASAATTGKGSINCQLRSTQYRIIVRNQVRSAAIASGEGYVELTFLRPRSIWRY